MVERGLTHEEIIAELKKYAETPGTDYDFASIEIEIDPWHPKLSELLTLLHSLKDVDSSATFGIDTLILINDKDD